MLVFACVWRNNDDIDALCNHNFAINAISTWEVWIVSRLGSRLWKTCNRVYRRIRCWSFVWWGCCEAQWKNQSSDQTARGSPVCHQVCMQTNQLYFYIVSSPLMSFVTLLDMLRSNSKKFFSPFPFLKIRMVEFNILRMCDVGCGINYFILLLSQRYIRLRGLEPSNAWFTKYVKFNFSFYRWFCRRKEEDARKALLMNPVKMKQLEKAVRSLCIVITLYHFGRLDLVFLSQCTVSSDIVECVLLWRHNLQGFITIWYISLACLGGCSFTKYRRGVKFLL